MARIKWDETGKRRYETGVSNGILFLQKDDGSYEAGVPWNGLSSVSESPSGGDENKIYADNMKYLSLFGAEDFGATVEAYTYPDEFEACDGSYEIVPGVKIGQQARKGFGFVFRTEVGNDTQGTAYGYILHIVYNCKAEPSDRQYQTINDSPDAINFSWTVSTTPERIDGFDSAAAQIKIDSTKVSPAVLKKIEDTLYGTDDPETEPTLPKMADLVAMIKTAANVG